MQATSLVSPRWLARLDQPLVMPQMRSLSQICLVTFSWNYAAIVYAAIGEYGDWWFLIMKVKVVVIPEIESILTVTQ